nr:hypothetical protein [uncultured Dysosmobacter sp.]
MKPKVKVELNHANMARFLKSSEVTQLCESIATDNIFRKLPAGEYEITARPGGKSRGHVRISTATASAYQDNLDNNTLLKAMGGR